MTERASAWGPAPPRIALTAGTVHIWSSATDCSGEVLRARQRLLSPAERDHLERIRHPRRHREFILGRGLLRRILGDALQRDPRELAYVEGARGKPGPSPDWLTAGIRFNISHTEGLVLVALAVEREVGVDVERVRNDVDWERLSERYFSRAERNAIRALAPALRAEAFFTCWARKESLVKAHGGGIASGLASFDVTVDPGRPARLLAARGANWADTTWSLHELDVGPGYAACASASGERGDIHCWSDVAPR